MPKQLLTYRIFISLCCMLLALMPAGIQAQGIAVDPVSPMTDTNAIKNNVLSFDTINTNADTTSLGNPREVRTDSDGDTILIDTARVQKTDSIIRSVKIKERRHSPTLAAIFSAVLPGLGQGYNKKYWKIPIVYAGLGGLGFGVGYTAAQFKGYRNAYRLEVDENPNTTGSFKGIENAAELKTYRDFQKRNLDICSIVLSVWYLLNIVDAAVDAHLFNWNMKDDLDVSWAPTMLQGGPNNNTVTAGLSVRFGF